MYQAPSLGFHSGRLSQKRPLNTRKKLQAYRKRQEEAKKRREI